MVLGGTSGLGFAVAQAALAEGAAVAAGSRDAGNAAPRSPGLVQVPVRPSMSATRPISPPSSRAKAVRPFGVCSGAAGTEMWNRYPAEVRAAQFKRMTGHLPTARMGAPAELAQTYLHLMRATYTTGPELVVGGGQLLL